MRIGLAPHDLVAWEGGREFFRLAATSLRAVIRPPDTLRILHRRGRDHLGWKAVRLARGALRGDVSRSSIDEELARRSERTRLRALLGGGFAWTGLRQREATGLSVVGPLGTPPPALGGVPWLGFIPDLQHRHLPEMFAEAERQARDRQFAAILRHAGAVVVNSEAVRRDLELFYPDLPHRLLVLPFSPVIEPEWLKTRPSAAAALGIATPYFICSNQFWRHKNHAVIFRALASSRDAGCPLRMVFTNATVDYRHPGYFADLLGEIDRLGVADQVHILGLLPKAQQIDLMRGACAVVQPTLFEGGPGGGSIWNAVGLGLPTIVSDIPVNREIASAVTHFFDPHDSGQLLAAMNAVAAAPQDQAVAADLLAASEERRTAFGQALRSAFALAAGLAVRRASPAPQTIPGFSTARWTR